MWEIPVGRNRYLVEELGNPINYTPPSNEDQEDRDLTSVTPGFNLYYPGGYSER